MRVDFGGSTGLVVGPTRRRRGARAPKESVDLLSYGEPADIGLDPGEPDRRFEYRIGRRPGFLDGRPGIWWTVNGHLFPDIPMYMVSEGDVVVFEIDNGSGDDHPMHLHGHHAVVLSRDGEPATGSPWWVDSLEVKDGETFEIAFVADNPGHLDGPLPQPPARDGGAGRAHDVHRRGVVVPGRRLAGQPPGVNPRPQPTRIGISISSGVSDPCSPTRLIS